MSASGGSRCDRLNAEGTVTAVEPDGHVEVEFDLSRCAGCRGACSWRRAVAQRVKLRAAVPLVEGDPVTLTLPARGVLSGAWWLHGLPLGALLVGAGVGAAVSGTDLGTALGAVAGVALAFSVAPRWARRAEAAALSDARVELRERVQSRDEVELREQVDA